MVGKRPGIGCNVRRVGWKEGSLEGVFRCAGDQARLPRHNRGSTAARRSGRKFQQHGARFFVQTGVDDTDHHFACERNVAFCCQNAELFDGLDQRCRVERRLARGAGRCRDDGSRHRVRHDDHTRAVHRGRHTQADFGPRRRQQCLGQFLFKPRHRCGILRRLQDGEGRRRKLAIGGFGDANLLTHLKASGLARPADIEGVEALQRVAILGFEFPARDAFGNRRHGVAFVDAVKHGRPRVQTGRQGDVDLGAGFAFGYLAIDDAARVRRSKLADVGSRDVSAGLARDGVDRHSNRELPDTRLEDIGDQFHERLFRHAGHLDEDAPTRLAIGLAQDLVELSTDIALVLRRQYLLPRVGQLAGCRHRQQGKRDAQQCRDDGRAGRNRPSRIHWRHHWRHPWAPAVMPQISTPLRFAHSSRNAPADGVSMDER